MIQKKRKESSIQGESLDFIQAHWEQLGLMVMA
jgi:hypothetical protein